MFDYSLQLRSALNNVLPTHYELELTNKKKTPCISYQERNNYTTSIGDTMGYSRISYTVKVWDVNIERIQNYCIEIDAVLRPLGFKRIATTELHDRDSSMIQKIMTFEANVLEDY